MNTSAVKTKPEQKPNTPFIVMSLLAGIASFITAILMVSGRYLEIGYKTTADDISYAGMQIWGLNQLAAVITVCIVLAMLAALLWPKFMGKRISWTSLLSLLLLILSLGITFFPYPFEFQVRQYHSAAESTYYLLAQGSGDFIAGNEVSFSGKIDTESIENYYTDGSYQTRTFNCPSETAWWWGKLAVLHHFSPILDKQNHLNLLKQRCTEVTNE